MSIQPEPSTPKKRNRGAVVLIIALVLLAICVGGVVIVLQKADAFIRSGQAATALPPIISYMGGPATLDEIVKYLGVDFPADATDVQYDAVIASHEYFINLSFKASPDGVDRFMRHICGGVLRQGYNPFKALYDGNKPPYMRIDISPGIHVYSYSPETPDTSWGNICMGVHDQIYLQIYLIWVDKAEPNLYYVKFESPDSCGSAHPPIPCSPYTP